MNGVEKLITEMLAVKQANQTLERSEILMMFSIVATDNLTRAINAMRMQNG